MPQKDGLYAIKLSKLGYITVPGKERFYSESNFDDNLLTGESIDDVYTLVKFKGNGLFEEYYSGENAILCASFYDSEQVPVSGLFNFFNEDSILTFKNEQEKKAKLDFLKKTPLIIDPSDPIQITPEIISMVNSSNIGDSVRSYIENSKEFYLQEFDQYEIFESENKSQKI